MVKRLDAAPLHVKLLGGFALVLAISAAQSGFAYWNAQENNTSDGWVDHAEHVLSLAVEAKTALIEMNGDYRGFMLSGDEALLDPYSVANQTYLTDLASLEQLTTDDPPQLARWQDLEQGLNAWQADVIEPGLALCVERAKPNRGFGGSRTRKTADAVQPKRLKPYSGFG